jgi:hypothetical protein
MKGKIELNHWVSNSRPSGLQPSIVAIYFGYIRFFQNLFPVEIGDAAEKREVMLDVRFEIFTAVTMKKNRRFGRT